MNLVFAERGWEDYVHWQSEDRQMLRRINALVQATQREPFDGIGKPEALRGNRAGYWSRRITEEHRMVYRLKDSDLVIVGLRYHYR